MAQQILPGSIPAIQEFEVSVRQGGACTIVAIHGELCLSTAAALAERVAEASNGRSEQLVLDLREVTFMDSTGIRELLDAEAVAIAAGQRFAIVLEGGQPERVLELVGMTGRPARMPAEDLPDA